MVKSKRENLWEPIPKTSPRLNQYAHILEMFPEVMIVQFSDEIPRFLPFGFPAWVLGQIDQDALWDDIGQPNGPTLLEVAYFYIQLGTSLGGFDEKFSRRYRELAVQLRAWGPRPAEVCVQLIHLRIPKFEDLEAASGRAGHLAQLEMLQENAYEALRLPKS